MFVVTHALAPVVVAGVVNAAAVECQRAPVFTNRQLIAIGVAGASPDVLWPHLSLYARLHSPTHTLWFLLATYPLFLWLCRRWWPDRQLRVAHAMSAGVALHLFADAIAGGIAWLYPFSDSVVGVRFVPYRLWIYSDLLFMSLTAIIVSWVAIRDRHRAFRESKLSTGSSG